MSAERPILMSAPMVRALLREIEAPGTGKTQTRRVLGRRNCAVLGDGVSARSPAWRGLLLDHPAIEVRTQSTIMLAVCGRDAPLGRPTVFGNPFLAGAPGRVIMSRAGDAARGTVPLGRQTLTAAGAVHRYRCWLTGRPPYYVETKALLDASAITQPAVTLAPDPAWRREVLRRLPELAGCDLVRWCPLDGPCHAEVLLELANGDDA